MKKGQVTLYIIIGLVIVALLSLILYYNANKQSTDNSDSEQQTLSSQIDQDYLNTLIHKCVKETVIESEKMYGIHRAISPPLMSKYISGMLPYCVNNFYDFKKEGFEVTQSAPSAAVDITNDAIVVDVVYKVTLKRRGLILSFDKYTYTFPRVLMQRIEQGKATRLISPDGTILVDIPEGTQVTLDGRPVNTIGIKQLDREFNGMSNSVIAGMTTYDFLPHGARFSKPVKITYYYEDKDIPPYIKEENLKVGYFKGDLELWVGQPTTVDPVNNRMMIETDHFSVYGTVVNCGGTTDPIKQIITPVLVQEACGPCKDPNWKYLPSAAPPIPQLGRLATPDCNPSSNTCYNDRGAPATKCKSADFTSVNGLTYDETTWNKCGVVQCEIAAVGDAQGYLSAFTNPEIKAGDLMVGIDTSAANTLLTDLKTQGIVDSGNLIQKPNYFLFKRDCDAQCPGCSIIPAEGRLKCGDLDDTKCPVLAVCKDQKAFIYNKATDLKGRAYYEVSFPAKGDSCIAGESKPSSTSPTAPPSLGNLGIDSAAPPVDPNAPAVAPTKKGNHVDSEVQYYTAIDGAKPYNFEFIIHAECYESDDCVIFMPGKDNQATPVDHTWTTGKKIINGKEISVKTLKFYIETNNTGDETTMDACIMANARIEFLGTQPVGTYNLICDKNSEGVVDIVSGTTCMQCVEKPVAGKDSVFIWEKYGDGKPETCLGLGDSKSLCPASLIGRKYNLLDGQGKPICYLCEPSTDKSLVNGLPYGQLVKVADSECDLCLDPSASSSAATDTTGSGTTADTTADTTDETVHP